MPEVLSVDNVIRIAEAGEDFSLDCSTTPLPDLLAIAAAASRSTGLVRFGGLASRPLEDLMRITVASQGRVLIDSDTGERRPLEPRRWFGRRSRDTVPAFPAMARALHHVAVQDHV